MNIRLNKWTGSLGIINRKRAVFFKFAIQKGNYYLIPAIKIGINRVYGEIGIWLFFLGVNILGVCILIGIFRTKD